jgi:hypothetical protein
MRFARVDVRDHTVSLKNDHCRRQLEKSQFAPVRNVTRLGAG